MIVEWKTILVSLPVSLFLLVICYGTGALMCRGLVYVSGKYHSGLHNKTNTATIFWKIISGMLMLTGCYACIVTGLRTTLLPLPVLAVLLLYFVIPETTNAPQQSNSSFTLLKFLVAAVLLYWVFYALHHLLIGNQAGYIGGDTLFYAWAADHLNNSGFENVTPGYREDGWNNVELYHYGDLWLIALVQKLTSLAPAVILPLIVCPVWAATFCLGLVAYLNPSHKRRNGNFLWLLLFAGFASGFAFLFPEFLFARSITLAIPLADFPKLNYPALFLIGILILLRSNSWNGCFLLSAISTVCFINSAPPVIASVGIIFLFTIFIQRQKVKINFPLFVFSILSISYYFVFYSIYPSPDMEAGGLSFNLKRSLNIFGSGLFHLLPLSPFLILLFFYWLRIRKNKEDIRYSADKIFMFILPFIGLGCWALIYFLNPETIQFYYSVFIPISSIFIATIITETYERFPLKWSLTAISLFVVSVLLNFKPIRDYSTVNLADKNAYIDLINKHDPGGFAAITGKHTSTPEDKDYEFTRALNFTNYYYPSYYNISLDAPFQAANPNSQFPDYEKYLLDLNPFSRYIKKRNLLATMPDYAYLFITERSIKYLTISPDTSIPASLQKVVRDSIQLPNRWRLYFIEK